MFHARKENAFGPKGKVKQGTPLNKPGGKYCGTHFRFPSFPGILPPPINGTEQPGPVRAALDAPRLLSSAAVPLLSRATPTAALLGVHGTVAPPRESGWRRGGPVFQGGY